MMHITAEEVRALRDSIAELESRLANQERALSEQTKTLSGIASRDDRERLLAAGWNYVSAFLLLLTLLFFVALTFEIFKGAEVKATADSLTADKNDNVRLREEFRNNAQQYTRLQNNMARADAIIAEANREYFRGYWQSAAEGATEAIKSLFQEPADGTRLQLTYNPNTCMLDPIPGAQAPLLAANAPKQPQFGSGESAARALDPLGLQPARKEYLLQALEIRFRSNFYARPAGWKRNILDDAQLIALLDENAGYHWFGLVETTRSDTDHAIACFVKSTTHAREFKRDYINLAELMLTKAKYPEVISYAEEFLEEAADKDTPFQNALEAVAALYWSIAKELQTDGDASARKEGYLHRFRQRMAITSGTVSTVGSFDDSFIENYLLKTTDLTELQKKEIKRAKECMVLRQCQDKL